MSALYKLLLSERMEPRVRKCLHKIIGHFLLVIDGRGHCQLCDCQPWAGGPGLYKKAD